jgi:hypothetical protein
LGESQTLPAKSPGEQRSPDAPAIAATKPRRRVPIWLLGAGGALVAAAYALLVERMHFGPPLVMFMLGGMTLALTGAALVRVIDPLAGNSLSAVSTVRGGRRPRELEREKQLVLKAIKEIELDYQMRKIADRDYREMVERYRTRAMRVMSEIEAGDDFRVLIERELAMRLKLDAAKPVASETAISPAAAALSTNLAEEARRALVNVTPEEKNAVRKQYGTGEKLIERPSCPSCETVNDDDAKFCKKCGAKLSQS